MASKSHEGDPDFEIRKPTKQEREEIKKIFSQFDNNGDNKISKYELLRAVRKLGCYKSTSAKDLEVIMEEDDIVDGDHDGYVSLKEFEKLIMRSKSEQEYEQKLMLQAFKCFDLNGDGFISKKELMYILTKAGDPFPEAEAEELINEADLNGDGKISYEEFVAVMFTGTKPTKENKASSSKKGH